jgi:phosphoribosylanthranilate isomerase
MRIKICGLFREQDIEIVNESLPDFIGFVFAESKRKVSFKQVEQLRKSLNDKIIPVGIFVNAPIPEIVSLYKNGIISIVQLHGNENAKYIEELKTQCDSIQVIKTIQSSALEKLSSTNMDDIKLADYILIDSGAGNGKTFNWNVLKNNSFQQKWFLAGGINLENIEQAISFNPFCIDVSSGTETDGVKDRNKILRLVEVVKNLNKGTQYE